MQIVGIGIDIEDIVRTDLSMKRYGVAWLKRQFTDIEIERAALTSAPATYFTVLFAAKEAVSKALGHGIDDDLTLLSMEIRCEKSVSFSVAFLGNAILVVNELNVGKVQLSATIFDGHVVATAIAERRG
jgi:holo-[acyl-carrier protein] synthase